MKADPKDIFICHAGEDKEKVARPLAARLESAGISCWLDEAEVRWGESIVRKVNEGLGSARFVIVVLSQAFVEKNWPQRELDSTLHEEAGSGKVRVLPLLVGGREQHSMILEKFLLLRDKRYLVWDGTGENVLQEIRRWLPQAAEFGHDSAVQQTGSKITIPRIKRHATDQEKEQFLRESFDTIKTYFQKGLQEVERQIPEASTDFEELSRYKFVSRIYLQGHEKCSCKIWRGGIGSDGIAYVEGRFDINQDSSFNEQIVIEDKGHGLGLKMLMGNAFGKIPRDRLLSATEAAEALWGRFIERLQ
jgi:hypothetical protein